MQNRLRDFIAQIDRGLILVIFLSLGAAWPFLFRASLPRETDAELHVFRAAELGYSLRALELYPRWAPDFYFGYGYPIFNYYAPLTYYLANIFSLAIPGGAVFGTKVVIIATYVLAGVGTYKLGQLYAGSRAGIIAAASYLFAPYIYIIDSHLRGDVAEFVALGIAPAALWASASFQLNPTRRNLLLAAIAPAALILSHNLLGLAIFGMLVGQWLWLAISRQTNPMSAIYAAMPLVLAVGLAAFFWLPVALESSAVQLDNLVGPGHFDFREHFLGSVDLFAPSLPLDLGSVNPKFRFNLGLVQWVLGALGLLGLALVLVRHPDRSISARMGIFWLISSIILIVLMLQISLPLWETVPLMSFFQFPWRMLGPAALCVAMLGGYCTYLLPALSKRVQPRVFAVATILPILSAFPIWSPPAWEPFGPTDQVAMLDFELSGFALGTTSTGDFVPSTVDVVPLPAQTVVDSYRSHQPIDRINYDALPASTSVILLNQKPTREHYHVKSDESFNLTLYRFLFPGWKVTIDGEPVAIHRTEPEGFIQFSVPAGEHDVRVWFGLTPPRILATMISVISLLVLIGLTFFQMQSVQPEVESLATSEVRMAASAVSLILVLALAGSLAGVWQPRSTGLTAIPADHETFHHFEGGIDFIGYDITQSPLRPGDEIPITLYWKAREPIPANYQVFLHLTTVPEHIWGQSDKLNPGDYPTTRWPLDKYVRDPHSFTIPLGTPPGTYEVRIGLWNRSTGRRQLLLEPDGTILGDSLALPTTIEISAPRSQPAIDDLPLDVTVNIEVADGLTLLGADLDPEGAFAAELGHLAIRLYWLSTSGNLPDYQVALRLVAADGSIAVTKHDPITDGLYPTDEWGLNSIVRDIHTIWFDSTIPAGTYTIEFSLHQSDVELETEWIRLVDVIRS